MLGNSLNLTATSHYFAPASRPPGLPSGSATQFIDSTAAPTAPPTPTAYAAVTVRPAFNEIPCLLVGFASASPEESTTMRMAGGIGS